MSLYLIDNHFDAAINYLIINYLIETHFLLGLSAIGISPSTAAVLLSNLPRMKYKQLCYWVLRLFLGRNDGFDV